MKSVVERLERARAKHTLIRLWDDESDCLSGYITGVGEKWVVLALVSEGMSLDGYKAVPIADIRKVKKHESTACFHERALRLRGEWPPKPPSEPVSLVSARSVAESVRSPLLTIHPGRWKRDVCYIGVPVKFGRRYLHLVQVTTNAVWEDETTKWEWDVITQIDWGGQYERALYEVAGPPPSAR